MIYATETDNETTRALVENVNQNAEKIEQCRQGILNSMSRIEQIEAAILNHEHVLTMAVDMITKITEQLKKGG